MPKPRGLWNNGNTCYFNATLQNLYRTIVFRRNLVDLWKQKNQEPEQKNQAPVVIEPTSSESSFLARVWYNVKKLFRNGELRKCFFLCLASLVLYKAGSSGILIPTARWILVPSQGLNCTVHWAQKLSSNVSAALYFVDDGATCEVINSKQYLDLQFCPRCDQPVVVSSLPSWFAVVALASSVCFCFICCIKHLLRNFFGKGLTRFSECGKKLSSSVTGWWSRSDKVVLCCSGILSYCAGHLMASSQQISEGLLERNPETFFVPFVMASSTCLLLYRLRVTELVLFRDFRQRSDEGIGVALARLFGNIESSSEASCHNPRSVLEAVCRRSNRFLGFRQQDSHELLRHLLDGIREEERNLKKEANSLTLVDRVFGGHFRTVYTCETCKAPYCLYEAFLDISLPITLHEDTLKELSDTDNTEINRFSPTGMSQQHSIEFWLKVFTRSENLGKQYLCSACNVSSTGDNYIMTHGIKQTLICDPPAILCIHVKRFRRTADDFVKANDHVQFSQYLDLKPYLTDACRRLGENTERVMYALYGVVVHSGSLEGGHYTAYIKSQAGGGQGITEDNIEEFLQQEGFDWDSLSTGTIGRLKTESLNIRQSSPNLSPTRKWYYCSDSTVMPVAANEVFKQAAYLLFYERLC